MAESAPVQEATAHTRVDGQGRVLIPADMRRALGLKEGDRVTLVLEDGGLTLLTARESVRRVREAFAPYLTPGTSLVDDLLADRRAEVEREAGGS